MNQLTKTSSREELQHYFASVIDLSKCEDQFPVNLDDVWPLVYAVKRDAVRALKKSELFIEGIDYIAKEETKEVLRNNAQNPTNEKEIEDKDLGGRPTDNYYLSLSCLEFFIARKVRPIFEIYRKVLHFSANRNEGYLLAVIAETRYNLSLRSSIDDIAGFISDMYREEQNGNIFPIYLPEVLALHFTTMGAAIDELRHHSFGYKEGQDYIYKEEGSKTGYYLSFNGFNQLIANRNTFVRRAYERAVKTGMIPEMPELLNSEAKLLEAKVSKKMMKIRNISGTKKEQAMEIIDRIIALIGQAEYIEEVEILNKALDEAVQHYNFYSSLEEVE